MQPIPIHHKISPAWLWSKINIMTTCHMDIYVARLALSEAFIFLQPNRVGLNLKDKHKVLQGEKNKTKQNKKNLGYDRNKGTRYQNSAFCFSKTIFFLFNPHLKICFLILEREEGRGTERETLVWEKHESYVFRMCPDLEANTKPSYVHWLGIEPLTFWCTGRHSSQLSQPDRVKTIYLYKNLQNVCCCLNKYT